MCVFICVYNLYMCFQFIYVFSIYICLNMFTYVYKCLYMIICVYICLYVFIYVYMCLYMFIYKCIYIYMCVWFLRFESFSNSWSFRGSCVFVDLWNRVWERVVFFSCWFLDDVLFWLSSDWSDCGWFSRTAWVVFYPSIYMSLVQSWYPRRGCFVSERKLWICEFQSFMMFEPYSSRWF